MSIKFKLVLLIILVLFSVIAGLGLFFGMTLPLREVEAELQTLVLMKDAFLKLQVESARFSTQFVEQQIQLNNAIRLQTRASFQAIANFKVLPKLNERIQTSLGLIEIH